jgi:hypothetical protein
MTEYVYKEDQTATHKRILRPMADVLLSANGISIETSMYIDSGADVSVIPLSLGLSLGFAHSEGTIQEMKGFGTEIPYIKKTIKMRIGENPLDVMIAWALIEDIPSLLGRKDVFDAFKITFIQREKKVIFEPWD